MSSRRNSLALLFSALLAIGFCSHTFAARVASEPAKGVDWAAQPISAPPLIIGESTWKAVTQTLLGPTYQLTGDGGDPRQLCYAQKMPSGANVRIVLSFFGSFEGGSLSAIEWTVSKLPLDSWLTHVCRIPAKGALMLGIDSGVMLGDSRAKARRVLGAPTRIAARRDDYARISRHGLVDRSTDLALTFDEHNLLVRLEVRRTETN